MLMKKIILTLVLFWSVSGLFAQQTKPAEDISYNPNLLKDSSKKSINSRAVGILNGDSVIIDYHSPGVRKRIIWGGLVPFDEVWVTGAHDATTIYFSMPVKIGSKDIPAGKYAFFTIPGKEEWTFILNSNWHQHLATEYDKKDDIVRMKVKPEVIDHTERLQYFVEVKDSGKGKIAVAWEKLRVEMKFKVANK